MKKTQKPSIVPTLRSSLVLAWSVIFVLAFTIVVWIYLALSALERERAVAAEPVSTRVEGPGISCFMPSGWMAYSRTDTTLRMNRDADRRLPFVEIESRVDPMAPYHALDTNPVLIMHKISERLALGLPDGQPEPRITMHGLQCGVVKPGVTSVYFLFSVDSGLYGHGSYFFNGDRRYFIWGLADNDDEQGKRELDEFLVRAYGTVRIPDAAPEIDRPIVNSGLMTAEGNARILKESERELAMWRLFSERARTEPATALLPALNHFREAVRLLSSVRQEKGVLASKEYARYRELLAQRRNTVAQWFVLLDKYRAMRDIDAAIRQAKYIVKHATLMGEGPDVRRAQDVLAVLETKTETPED